MPEYIIEVNTSAIKYADWYVHKESQFDIRVLIGVNDDLLNTVR